MHIWTIVKWKKFYNKSNRVRSGLRLKFDPKVNNDVKKEINDFCKWLRKEYYFPMRIPVYVKSSTRIKAMNGEMFCGTFSGSPDLYVEPYIRIATGDFDDLLGRMNYRNAINNILFTLAHEFTHYFQWINGLRLSEMGEERQARQYAFFIIQEYEEYKGFVREIS